MTVMERVAEEVKGGVWGRLRASVARVSVSVLDQIYPPGCPSCGAPLVSEEGLCGGCFAKLRAITAPMCAVLGVPFEVDMGEGGISLEARQAPPPFLRARAAVQYDELARTLISRLKYGDRPELARFCARLMASAGHEFWGDKPVLVPVPLHSSRLRIRRYNQSVLLAQALGKSLGLEVDAFLVKRIRKTRQQVGLRGPSRAANVQGAFAAHPRALVRLKGRGVVIVDDVYTTGATVKSITRTLKRSGIDRIEVLTFARVVIGDDKPI